MVPEAHESITSWRGHTVTREPSRELTDGSASTKSDWEGLYTQSSHPGRYFLQQSYAPKSPNQWHQLGPGFKCMSLCVCGGEWGKAFLIQATIPAKIIFFFFFF